MYKEFQLKESPNPAGLYIARLHEDVTPEGTQSITREPDDALLGALLWRTLHNEDSYESSTPTKYDGYDPNEEFLTEIASIPNRKRNYVRLPECQ